MNIDWKQTDLGIELPVKATAGAGKNEIRGVVDGSLKVCVTAIAEKGNANKAIIKLLSKELKISKSRVELISGATSSRKKFLLVDASDSDLRVKLIRLLG